MKAVVLLLSLSLILSKPVFAQVNFDHLTKAQGLPNNSITTIAQDHLGFMWFGTYNGLVRYDGYNFKTFVHDKEDSLSLPDNQIRALYVHPNGDIYIGFNYKGFAVYHPEKDIFEHYYHIPGQSNSLVNDDILTIEGDKAGNVWIGTKEGLDLFNAGNKSFIHYSIKEEKPVRNLNCISSIFIESETRIWLYSVSKKVFLLNPSDSTFRPYTLASDPLDKIMLNRGGTVLIDRRKQLWIGTEFEGLYKMDPKTGSYTKYSEKNGRITGNVILDMMEDKDGIFWVATDGGGLLRYERETDTFTAFRYDPENQQSISTNAVYCLFETDPGIIWAGTFAGGINIYKKHKHKFTSYSNRGAKGKSLSYKSVLAFAKGPGESILIGTDGGGLNHFHPETQTFTYDSKSSGFCFDIVKSLLTDSKGRMWAGSYGSGLCMHAPDGKQIHITASAEPDNTHLSHPSVWALEEDPQGRIWIGLLEHGIDILDPETGTIRHINTGEKGLLSGNIYTIYRDSRQRMWVGTETGGLFLYHPETDSFTSFSPANSRNIYSNYVKVIFEDRHNQLWVGFESGGLALLADEQGKVFKHIGIREGLPGKSVYGITEDLRGNLWISTDDGLACYHPSTGKFRTFDTEDGLISNEFAYGAIYQDTKGNIYLGSGEGFSVFHPDSLWFNEQSPNVCLTSIEVINKPIQPSHGPGSPYITASIPYTRLLTLSHEDYMVTFHFSALEYLIPTKNKYAYMLEGLDRDWVYTNAAHRYATYTSLPPGDYRFLLKASNNDGVWCSPKVITVRVLPPWWNTYWFRGMVALAGIGLIMSIIYFKVHREKALRVTLEGLVHQRTSELRQSNEELNKANYTKDKLFSIIAHDLKGPANSIKALTTNLAGNYDQLEEKQVKQYLRFLSTSSVALADMVSNLLTWAKLHTRNLKAQKQELKVTPVIRRVAEIYQVEASNKNISLVVETDNNDATIVTDPDMFETILRNLVNNAMKFTKANGKITVGFSESCTSCTLFVKDTGVGMAPETVAGLFRTGSSTQGTHGETGTGLGLTMCRDFAEANGGSIEVESKEGEGTTFRVHFPKDNSSASPAMSSPPPKNNSDPSFIPG